MGKILSINSAVGNSAGVRTQSTLSGNYIFSGWFQNAYQSQAQPFFGTNWIWWNADSTLQNGYNLNFQTNTLDLVAQVGGVQNFIWTGGPGIPIGDGAWHYFEIHVMGADADIYLDGALVHQLRSTDPNYQAGFTSGFAAYYVESGTTIIKKSNPSFDDATPGTYTAFPQAIGANWEYLFGGLNVISDDTVLREPLVLRKFANDYWTARNSQPLTQFLPLKGGGAAPASPFIPYDWGSRPIYNATFRSWFGPLNLPLLTTIPPTIPFNSFDWQSPKVARNEAYRGVIQQPQIQPGAAGLPVNNYDWPMPRTARNDAWREPYGLLGINVEIATVVLRKPMVFKNNRPDYSTTLSSQPLNQLLPLGSPIAGNPFAPYLWPNPSRSTYIIPPIAQSAIQFQPAAQQPFAPYDWTAPKPSRNEGWRVSIIPNVTILQPAQATPFSSFGWPNPQAADYRATRQPTSTSRAILVPPAGTPIAPYPWDSPRSQPIVFRQWQPNFNPSLFPFTPVPPVVPPMQGGGGFVPVYRTHADAEYERKQKKLIADAINNKNYALIAFLLDEL
jgi:hypothetical protein